MNLLHRLHHNAPLKRLSRLSGEARQKPCDTGAHAGAFDPFGYFPGLTRAWGIVQGRRGDVLRRFEATINGYSDGRTLVLDEQFRYADGELQSRTWRILRDEHGNLRGTANDIIGVAAGTSTGDSMCWRYTMEIEVRGRRHRVRFDDRMWQLDADVLVNRSTMRKFGLRLADVTIFLRKEPV